MGKITSSLFLAATILLSPGCASFIKKTQQAGEETQRVLLEQHPSYRTNALPDSGHLHMLGRDYRYYTIHQLEEKQE